MGYSEAPWIFKGRALYQLQLVKSEEARKYIPDNFKLVELFGHTLGGFYLARYEDSPAGTFDELVTLAGLVWNAPTSCAWAARVYVNSKDARDHGLKSVGLPSRLASFSDAGPSTSSAVAQDLAQAGQAVKSVASWWRQAPSTNTSSSKSGEAGSAQGSSSSSGSGGVLEIRNLETARSRKLDSPVCLMQLPPASTARGPPLRLSLPSFSGGTADHPGLLKYSCDLATRVRLVSPAVVQVPRPLGPAGAEDSSSCCDGGELMAAVLGGKPLIAMAFDDMVMTVQEPERLLLPSSSSIVVHQPQLAAASVTIKK